MMMVKSLLMGASLAAIALASPALAQVSETPQGDAGSPEASAEGGLDVIVVTAQKREQNLQDVPISVAAIGEDLLEKSQFSEIDQISTISPSVNFQAGFTPGATNFNIRGVGSYAFTGGIQPSVSLVIDGVPLARAGEFVTDVGDVQRIEVLRGPQGTLFGRNSTGGAINITRNRPTRDFEGEVEATATSDEEYTIRGVLSGPISEDVRYRLAGVYSDRSGFIKNYTGPDLAALKTVAVSGKLEFDISDGVNLMLNGDYSKRDHSFTPGIALRVDGTDRADLLRGINVDAAAGLRVYALGNGDLALGQKILDDPFATSTNTPANNQNIAYGFSADLTVELNDDIQLKSITAYRTFSDDSGPDVDGTPAAPDNYLFGPSGLIYPVISTTISQSPVVLAGGTSEDPARQVDSDYFMQELRFEGSHDRFDWTAGGFYQTFDEYLINATPLLLADYFNPAFGNGANFGGTATPNDEYILNANIQDNSYSVETFAAFGDVTFHVTDSLDVFGGIRWTSEKISKTLTNRNQFALFSLAQLDARYDPATGVLDTSGIFERPLVQGEASAKEDFISYRVGASYEISDTFSVYGTVSRGQVGPAAPISYTDDLSFLAPTQADNYEVGFKSELLDRRVRLNGAAFKIDVTNLQASALVPGTVNTTTLNAGDLDIKGFELDLSAAVTNDIVVGSSVVYLDATIENLLQACFADQRFLGNELAQNCNIDANNDGTPETQDVSGFPATNTPKWAFNTYASFTIPTNGLPFNFYGLVNYSWKDKVQFQLNQDDLTVQKSYGILDLTLGIRDIDERYEVFIFGKNVLDQFYVNDAFSVTGVLGRHIVRVPRNAQAYFGAGARFKF
ncbi:TonB-dependent receptor [Croceicoccus sp. BE223]|uniref:TonB-dependent receptor n=1 Tax=Croceicoccus sp. BE223 TaxID=2817716 RepID=UPI002858B796|nr:TonB-dependent receptor [Croceicoccus sp. BE223]MDR7103640.1 iron complex outermembrane receptor protein [Croceicoccus sp. BE223]